VIQSILLFTLRPGVTDEQVEALRAALAAIPSEGRRAMRLGRDIGLLDGGDGPGYPDLSRRRGG
jgi:hypothetical protein